MPLHVPPLEKSMSCFLLSPTLRSASNRVIEDFTTDFGSSQLENWRHKREISQGISILITSTCEVGFQGI